MSESPFNKVATFLKRDTPTQVFSCEYCEILEEYMRTTASNNMNVFTVCYSRITYAYLRKSTLYSCLNVKVILARNRRYIWSLGDSNGFEPTTTKWFWVWIPLMSFIIVFFLEVHFWSMSLLNYSVLNFKPLPEPFKGSTIIAKFFKKCAYHHFTFILLWYRYNSNYSRIIAKIIYVCRDL